jgi:superfamily I DNA/RNA helicase
VGQTPTAPTASRMLFGGVDPAQARVLADDHQRLLIEAPAGSGKTRTAVGLVARDIALGRVGPQQRALVLTFSRNARAQLEAIAAELLSTEQRRRAEITNYHSWFWQKVSQFRDALGLPPELEIASEAQRRADVVAAMSAEGVRPVSRDHRQFGDYSRALEYGLPEGCPERLVDPRARSAEVAARLRELHMQTGRIHYDDLAYYAWLLLDRARELWHRHYPVIVLDEYQDSSPLQAAIVERLAGRDSRVYAFADPLQQIYEWRDASRQRLDEFRARGASEHRLGTLHRYRECPGLQRWMEQVRDVLLGEAAHVTIPLPPEVEVIHYDPKLPERGKVWGAEARGLSQLDKPIAEAFRSGGAQTIAVLARRREQLTVLERHLAKRFRCGRLSARDEALDFALEWVGRYEAASPEDHARRLLALAHAVAPRHAHLDFDDRLGPGGIDARRLREPRRALAESIIALAARCGSLVACLDAAQQLARLAVQDQDRRAIDWDTLWAFQNVLRAVSAASDDEARAQVADRIRQARFRSAAAPRRGLYLLSCHEGKGKEFDMVVLPHVSRANFSDDEESRQLLYVSLSRARRRLLVCLAIGAVPSICQRLGIAS